MSERDNFAGGFILGAILGGIVGGVLGATLASQRNRFPFAEDATTLPGTERAKQKKRPLQSSAQPNVELARRGLEDKIAQLNDAIDEARQRLGSSGNGLPEQEATSRSKPSAKSVTEESSNT
jgi:hypothetical protein